MPNGSTTPNEESQLAQTVEMFEVITQTQPQDYQSLEILKEAYIKLKREEDVINTSKRIAEAYVLMGQLSSAILEYESILQRRPDDAQVLAALGEIENQAHHLNSDAPAAPKPVAKLQHPGRQLRPSDVDDGRDTFHKLFVEGKVVAQSDFDACWSLPDLMSTPKQVHPPFIQSLSDRGLVPVEKSLRMLSDRGRFGYVPVLKYDYDVEFARSMPKETLLRWCVVPIDRMSKSVLVVTSNPYNAQAAQEVAEATQLRVLWYLAAPADIMNTIKQIIR